MHKRGDIQGLRSEISCLAVPKTSVGQPYRASLISGIETFYSSEGSVTIFCRNFLSHSADKFRREPFCAVFQKNSGSQKVYG